MDWVRLLSRLVQAESLPGEEGEAAGLLLEALDSDVDERRAGSIA